MPATPLVLNLTALPNLVASWLWPFARVGGLVAVAPVFGYAGVPVRARLAVALALTLLVAPVAGPMPHIDPFSLGGVLVLVHQLLVGLALGFALRLVFAALEVAGQEVAQLMGLGFATLVDQTSGVNAPVISELYIMLATLVFLALNGHLVAVQVLADSFHTIPVGDAGPGSNALWALSGQAGWIFSAAVLLALPAIAALIVVNLAFGVMSRAAPQLNIISVGFPVALVFGLLVVLYTLPGTVGAFRGLIMHTLSVARLVAAGGP